MTSLTRRTGYRQHPRGHAEQLEHGQQKALGRRVRICLGKIDEASVELGALLSLKVKSKVERGEHNPLSPPGRTASRLQ